MQRQDYLERMIAQLAEAIARILGVAASGRPEQAEREFAATWSSMFGIRRADLDRFDEATLMALVGQKRLPAATLLEAEAELLLGQGRPTEAARLCALAARFRG